MLYVLTAILVASIGTILQKQSLHLGLIATEVFLILIPTLFFIKHQNLPFRRVLRLYHTEYSQIAVSVIIGIGIWMFVSYVHLSIHNWFSTSQWGISAVVPQRTLQNILTRFISFGLFAGVCEELLFRGYIQGAYEQQYGKNKGIIWTSFMFTACHGDPTAYLPLFTLSLIICWVAWRTNSIFPCIVIHFTNNSIAPFLFGYLDIFNKYSMLTVAIAGLFITALSLWTLNILTGKRKGAKSSVDSCLREHTN